MASTLFFALFAVIAGAIIANGEVVPLVGGLSDMDVGNPVVLDLVKNLPLLTGDMDGLEVVKVARAQVQVVAGMKYVLSLQMRNKGSDGSPTQVCVAAIWVRVWLEKREVTSFKCQAMHPAAPGMLGGWQEKDVNDLAIKSANFGLEMINGRCNCLYRKSLFKIKRVQEKVVAGLMEKITVEMVDSTCRNTESNKGKGLQDCPARENTAAKECDMTIVYQAWMKPQFRLLRHTC